MQGERGGPTVPTAFLAQQSPRWAPGVSRALSQHLKVCQLVANYYRRRAPPGKMLREASPRPWRLCKD